MTSRGDINDGRDPVGGKVDAGLRLGRCDSSIASIGRGVRLGGNNARGLSLA